MPRGKPSSAVATIPISMAPGTLNAIRIDVSATPKKTIKTGLLVNSPIMTNTSVVPVDGGGVLTTMPPYSSPIKAIKRPIPTATPYFMEFGTASTSLPHTRKIDKMMNTVPEIKTAPKATLVPAKSYDEALDMLLKDKINAIVADYPYCAFAAFRYQEKGLVAGQSKFTFEPLGIAVPEDALLINWLGNFISMFEASGQLKNLNEKWFQDGSWIKELP